MSETGARIGLGTVQWGLDYGIANRTGRPRGDEIARMLATARVHGVDLLDTAAAYGDAETVLGEHDVSARGFSIVTKTLPLTVERIREEHVCAVQAAFSASLERLRCARVDALLVHAAENLIIDGADRLWDALQAFKAAGTAERIGISVYSPDQLEAVLDHYPVEVVQLPFNLYDTRFAERGLLSRLRQAGVEVHARSVFLQGLLLLDAEELPEYFRSIAPHQARLHGELARAGVSPMQAALAFCLHTAEIDRVIVGCESAAQLEEILQAASRPIAVSWEIGRHALRDVRVLEPFRWAQEPLVKQALHQRVCATEHQGQHGDA